jgi:hypothetical protein
MGFVEVRGFLRVALTDPEAAALILVVLRSEGEVPLAGLAEELGLSDRQFGMALGLLIRERQVRIRAGAEGIVLVMRRANGHTVPVGAPGKR